jgi:hypothetical protein
MERDTARASQHKPQSATWAKNFTCGTVANVAVAFAIYLSD